MNEIDMFPGPVFVNGVKLRAGRHGSVTTDVFARTLALAVQSVSATLPDCVPPEVKAGIDSAQSDDDAFWNGLAEGEKSFQRDVLSPWLKKESSGALSTDSSNQGAPYKTAHDGGGGSLGSGKPDGVMQTGPVCIEIKQGSDNLSLVGDDWGVLQEAIMRVRMHAACFAFLDASIALAVAGGNAYLVVMRRQHNRLCALAINRIKRSSVIPLWMHLHEQSMSRPHWFLTVGGCMLIRAMESAGVDPWRHTSQVLPTPQENVFDVRSMADDTKHVCAVKLNLDREDREVDIAKDLFPELQNTYPQPFYCFMALRGELVAVASPYSFANVPCGWLI
jgi:hypothetical protein